MQDARHRRVGYVGLDGHYLGAITEAELLQDQLVSRSNGSAFAGVSGNRHIRIAGRGGVVNQHVLSREQARPDARTVRAVRRLAQGAGDLWPDFPCFRIFSQVGLPFVSRLRSSESFVERLEY